MAGFNAPLLAPNAQTVADIRVASDSRARPGGTANSAENTPADKTPFDVPTAKPAKDKDLARVLSLHPEWRDTLDIIETTQEFDNQLLQLTEIRNPDLPEGPFYFVMHDDEHEAFDVMVWAVRTFGGLGIAIENNEQRLVDGGMDINREFGRASRPDLNYFFRTHIENGEQVIALHNNQDHPGGTMHLNNPAYFTKTCDAGDDVDDILIIGDIGGDPNKFCGREQVADLVAKGLNVGWSRYGDRRSHAFDCEQRCNFQKFVVSYLGQTYFNLEAQRGKGSDKQKRQICAVLDPDKIRNACADPE